MMFNRESHALCVAAILAFSMYKRKHLFLNDI